jgi:hypothetical protein
MIGKYSLAGATLAFAALAWEPGAHAAPVYIGLQVAGYLGGAITQEATGSGTASITNLVYGNATDGTFLVSATANGTPPLPEPDLNSTSVTATATFPGTISIYVTELNQFPTPGFRDFQSIFQAGLSFSGETVVESTYIDECLPVNDACGPSYIFDTHTLLSTTTFSSTGAVIATTNNGVPVTSEPIEETEVFAISFANQNSSLSASIDLSVVPEPTSIALFVAGLLGLGAIGRRKKA